MSIKIYNGYILKKEMSFKELSTFFNKIKEDLNNIKKEEMHKLLSNLFFSLIDTINLEGETKLANFSLRDKSKDSDCRLFWFVEKFIRMEAEKIEKTNLRNPIFDFYSNCAVFPIENNKTLITFYCENQKMTKHWDNISEISKYFYYSNSDEPEDITVEEWNQRKIDWAEAMGNSGVPSEEAFLRNFTSYSWYLSDIDKDLILDYAPSIQKRAKNIAKKHLKNDFYSTVETLDYIDVYDELIKWQKTEEYKILLELKIKDLEPKILKPSLDLFKLNISDIFLKKVNLIKIPIL